MNFDDEMLALREMALAQMQDTEARDERDEAVLRVTLTEWHSAPWWRVVIFGAMEDVYEDGQGPALAEALAELRRKLETR